MAASAILAAVDFSASSRAAAHVAALIAHRHGATLTLLHVDRIPEVVAQTAMRARADVWESYLSDRAESARHLLQEQASTLCDVATQIAVARDDVPRAIVQRAASDRSDLVVLGAHGVGTVGHSWLGSVPFEVAAHTRCPALIVREHGAPRDDRGFRRPLIAVGLDRPIDAAVAITAWLCADDAEFHVVHVSESLSTYGTPAVPRPAAEARREALAERASLLQAEAARLRGGAIVVHFDEAESASDAIFDRIEREKHDLVVVGQRASSRASGLLGSAARRLLEYADVSVALIPAAMGGV